MDSLATVTRLPTAGREWWRSAVIYQIYPRSFADRDGDGVGDLAGIVDRLPALADLGVDAVWLSPITASPQRDGGYDVSDYTGIDPLFGTLEDFEDLIVRSHGLGLRVIMDIVPNHSSSDHAWFREALAAGPGSPERDRYLFREGRGEQGELPPNNWESVFGGPAWTRVTEADGTLGQWYLHLFDSSQPDFDWSNAWVREQFHDILRFWLDRGIDGFRVDVAHGMVKADGLPDIDHESEAMGGATPYWAQDGVHEIWRKWRALLDEYPGDRLLVAEGWVEPLEQLARWVRPDEMHQAFNFSYLATPWDAVALRRTIDESLAAFGGVGAPSTWVLSNHDTIRHTTRLSMGAPVVHGHGVGPDSPGLPDPVAALHRARAATAVMLALPGSAYLYQGEELGLPEVLDIPADERRDPTWWRTDGERYGRDGCRVPLPWEADAPAHGFSATGRSWLPQPAEWGEYARDRQSEDPASTLAFYRRALAERREHRLGTSPLRWAQSPDGVLAFGVGEVKVLANLRAEPIALPEGTIVLASGPVDGSLPPDTTVWVR